MIELSSLTTVEIKARLSAVADKRKQFIATVCEGQDNGTPFDRDIEDLGAELARRMRLDEEAAFRAEWTVDVFNARRTEWSAEIAKLPRTAKGFRIEDVRALEARLGYTIEDAKRAKAMLGIA